MALEYASILQVTLGRISLSVVARLILMGLTMILVLIITPVMVTLKLITGELCPIK